jgi:hypothetical protein
VPRCFLHVPKSAGTSLRAALEAAFPPGSVAPQGFDTSLFCDFDAFDRLAPPARAAVVVGDEADALAGYPVVSGHFSLPTLDRVAPRSAVATVLREPRARLLSLYAYLRLTPDVDGIWAPYEVPGSHGTLDDMLAEPRAAHVVCSQLCRMLLGDDPRLPPAAFADPDDAEAIAHDAEAELAETGFVGVLELGDATWAGLSRHFGVELRPGRANETGASGLAAGREPVGRISAHTLELLEARTASERLVYESVVAQRLGSREEARRLADAAFAAQLVRYGELMGQVAAQAELASRDAHIRALEGSRSWRLTAPLRRARHAVRRRRPPA